VSESSGSTDRLETTSCPPSPARRARWQVGLRTMALLLAAIAVWMTYFINRRRNPELEARIAVMRPLAHELVVDDASKIAAVKLEELWFDDNAWDVHLPNRDYRLCVATRGIDENGMPSVLKSVRLKPGRHRLAVAVKKEKSSWRIAVDWDGGNVIDVAEPLDWNPDVGSSGGGVFSTSTQFDDRSAAVFFRRRFMRKDDRGSHSADGPTEGVMLWIERAAPSTSGR
jgi:hypothetical protein